MESVDRASVKLERENSEDTDASTGKSAPWVSNVKAEAASSTTSSPAPEQPTTKSSRSSSSSMLTSKKITDVVNVKADLDDGDERHKTATKDVSRPQKPRSTSSKNPPRIAPSFKDLPDATAEANKSYTVIGSCTYQNKYLGYTEHAMECDCSEEWGKF